MISSRAEEVTGTVCTWKALTIFSVGNDTGAFVSFSEHEAKATRKMTNVSPIDFIMIAGFLGLIDWCGGRHSFDIDMTNP